MKKITFVNDSEPYLSAENLNQLQDNIEEEINKIPLDKLNENYNIDNLKTNGTYGIFNATGTLPNGFSTTSNNLIIQCFIWAEDYGRQILHDVRTNNSYSRNIYDGVWQEWKQITMI
jgi:hypothetical protein